MSEIYQNDILNRFPGHTLTFTTDVNLITWELKDGGSNLIQSYQGLNDEIILQKLRENLGFPDSVLLLSTTTQRNALTGIEVGREIFNSTDGVPQTFNGSTWDSAGGLGYTLIWGGNMQTTGRYAQVHGITSGGQETGLSPGSEAVVPADGTLSCMTYSSGDGDNTTVFKIWKNGGVVHTFTASGGTGFEAGIGVTVEAGDLIAIEYDAGQKPAGSVYAVYID